MSLSGYYEKVYYYVIEVLTFLAPVELQRPSEFDRQAQRETTCLLTSETPAGFSEIQGVSLLERSAAYVVPS